jgi:nitroimidazol reductase NimA-like FMN-containing flavoprotein (pyridoxamine 5'-phosphate oxidase superfamily)
MITKQTVLDWLTDHSVATISTISAENKPQTAVVYTYVDTNYHCYFVTKETTRKYENLTKNKVISIAWYDKQMLTICELTGEAYVVQAGEGVAVAITHLQEVMMEQKTEYWTPPVGQIEGAQYAVFRVVPDQINYVDYSAATKLHSKPKRLEFLP